MSLPYMPFYPADFLGDTMRLSTMEVGAYCLLIFSYWQEGGLPDDDTQLARICRLQPRQWARIKDTISRFFYDGWKHRRIEKELARAAEKSDLARRSVAAREAKRTDKNNVHVKPNISSTITQKNDKSLNYQEAVSSFDDRSMNGRSSNQSQKESSREDSLIPNGIKGGKPPSSDLFGEKETTPMTPEKAFFQRGKEVLGQKAGGILVRIRDAFAGDLTKARQFIEQAADKQSPMEYVMASLRGKGRSEQRIVSPVTHEELDVPLRLADGSLNPAALDKLSPNRFKPTPMTLNACGTKVVLPLSRQAAQAH